MSIFADEFTDFMQDTVTIQRIVGRTDDGKPSYSSPVTYKARIDNKTRNVIGNDGQTVVARGRAWLDTVDEITVNDSVVFNGAGKPVVILNVNQVPDETGPAYTALDFQ